MKNKKKSNHIDIIPCELGFDQEIIDQNVVKQNHGFFGPYYAKLLNHNLFTKNWTKEWDSYSSGDGYKSQLHRGFHLKYYPNRAHSIGITRSGSAHYFEGFMEFLDDKFARLPIPLNPGLYFGKSRDNIYDMHGKNSIDFLNLK